MIIKDNIKLLKKFDKIKNGEMLAVGSHKVQPKIRKSLNDVWNKREAVRIDNNNDRLLYNLKTIRPRVP